MTLNWDFIWLMALPFVAALLSLIPFAALALLERSIEMIRDD